MSYCTDCGHKLGKDEKFCPKCGTKVSEKKKENKAKESISKEPTKKKSPAKAIVFIVLLALAVFFFWSMWSMNQDDALNAEYRGWANDYEAQIKQLDAIGQEYNELIQANGLSEDEFINRLNSITVRYAREYEVYKVKSEGFYRYIEDNKKGLSSMGFFSVDVEATKRAIQESNTRYQQNGELIKATLEEAISAKTAKSQMLQNALGLLVGLL